MSSPAWDCCSSNRSVSAALPLSGHFFINGCVLKYMRWYAAKCSLSASDLFSAKKMSHSGLPSGGNGDPMTYTGKSCQVTKSFGQATTDIYGADPFSLNLGALLGKGISDLSGSGSAAVQLAGDVVGNATAIGGK